MSAATLKERDESISVHRYDCKATSCSLHCQVGSWPKRLWETCGSRDGKPLWASRERSRQELARLRSWLLQATYGPREELDKRLIACAETPRNVSKATSGTRDFQPYNEGAEKKKTQPPPVYPENTTTYRAGHIQLEHGEIGRNARRIIAADSVRMFDFAIAARQLQITRPLLRELVGEYFHPQRYNYPLVAKHRLSQPESEIVWRTFQPYPIPSDRLPLRERVQILTERGIADTREIARRLQSNRGAVRRLLFPRNRLGGPCVKCESAYRQQHTRLDLGFCWHYSVAFAVEGTKTQILNYTRDDFIAELRRVEPPTTKPALEAWKGSWGFRYRVYKLSAEAGRNPFNEIMTELGNHKSLNVPTLKLDNYEHLFLEDHYGRKDSSRRKGR